MRGKLKYQDNFIYIYEDYALEVLEQRHRRVLTLSMYVWMGLCYFYMIPANFLVNQLKYDVIFPYGLR